MSYTDHLHLKVYEISTGNIDTFVRFDEKESRMDKIISLLEAYRKLWSYMDDKKELENPTILEVWQTPVPFSRTLGYATLFRLNPFDKAYLISPVRMEWLEPPDKKP